MSVIVLWHCEIFLDQGSNPCFLLWQEGSQPLDHQRSPRSCSLRVSHQNQWIKLFFTPKVQLSKSSKKRLQLVTSWNCDACWVAVISLCKQGSSYLIPDHTRLSLCNHHPSLPPHTHPCHWESRGKIHPTFLAPEFTYSVCKLRAFYSWSSGSWTRIWNSYSFIVHCIFWMSGFKLVCEQKEKILMVL